MYFKIDKCNTKEKVIKLKYEQRGMPLFYYLYTITFDTLLHYIKYTTLAYQITVQSDWLPEGQSYSNYLYDAI